MAELSSKGFIPEVRVLCGLPASGKSTEALKWLKGEPNRRVRINYDDLRKEMFGADWTWNRKDENAVQARAVQMFEDALKLGMSVIIDNTNLSAKVRQSWLDRALVHNIEAQVDEIGSSTPIWDLIERDSKRGQNRVGRAVIERMALFNGFIDWNDRETYPNEGFVICDLDGTLADISHRRKFVDGTIRCSACGDCLPPNIDPGPETLHAECNAPLTTKKDWKSFFANVADDALNAPVAELLDLFADNGYHILLVSGRPITPCGIPTEEWLQRHEVRYDHLFMRQGGDSRADTIVKREILDLLPIDRIDYVLDDRSSVVQMWRDAGLFVLQVDKGDF